MFFLQLWKISNPFLSGGDGGGGSSAIVKDREYVYCLFYRPGDKYQKVLEVISAAAS
jgi:hypothetical protein